MDQTASSLELLIENPELHLLVRGIPKYSCMFMTCALRVWEAVLAKSTGPLKPVVLTLSLRGEEPFSPSGSLGAIKNQVVKRALGNEG